MTRTRIALMLLASIAMLWFAGSAKADDDDDDDCCAPIVAAPCCPPVVDPCCGPVGAVSYGGYSGAAYGYYGGGYRQGFYAERHHGHRGRYYSRGGYGVVVPAPGYVGYYGY